MRNVIYGRLHRENAGLAYIGPLQANISEYRGKNDHMTDDVT